MRLRASHRWTAAGAAVLIAFAISCGGGGSTAPAPTSSAAPSPNTGGTAPMPSTATAQTAGTICNCVPGAPATADYRHDAKHVGLPGSSGQEITVGTILGWAVGPDPAWTAGRSGIETQMFHISRAYLQFVWLETGDCDIHMEISDSPDHNAPRVIVETPIDSAFCPNRQSIVTQLSARSVPISGDGYNLPTPLPVSVLGLAFQDYNHPRGSQQVATPWELHPAIVTVVP